MQESKLSPVEEYFRDNEEKNAGVKSFIEKNRDHVREILKKTSKTPVTEEMLNDVLIKMYDVVPASMR